MRIVLHYLEYAVVRTLVAAILSLGYERALGLGRALADVGFRLDRRHRARAIDNLGRAMPELSPLERVRVARESFRSFAQVLVESAYLPRLLTRASAPRLVRFFVHPEARAAIARGKGVVFATAHIGNWELTGQAAGIHGLPLVSVARPRENPLLEAYILRHRQRHGQRIVAKKGAVRALSRALREGGMLGILVDQNGGSKGVFVNFFGRPASTTGAPATLALRFDAPLIPSSTLRVGKGFRYEVHLERPLAVPNTGDRDEDVRLLTEAMTARVEAWVRANPKQWLWGHRRWKSRPKGEQ